MYVCMCVCIKSGWKGPKSDDGRDCGGGAVEKCKPEKRIGNRDDESTRKTKKAEKEKSSINPTPSCPTMTSNTNWHRPTRPSFPEQHFPLDFEETPR